ncbi:serine/threonine-protein kinase [Rhodopirellula sallentina]|uniref:Serine/threonine protein kinase n=1 Tax=Rhodopirellula sallentina SM41 TaxID=1263870 RepID=M5U6G5_9BACT|nr:serine/threonine-protein kinase [Rhodopirellula sallentina]EMI57035.1 serine/threonine protein kinase [Rhodopirellula sallentina SM41]
MTARPILDEETRSLVKRALASRVLTLEEIKTVVASLMTEDAHVDSQRLADGLRNAGLLTRWQASKLLSGKSRGFFLGAYKLLRPLGRGGMGMVYLGEHQVMKRQMALKVLPPDALKDTRRIERFKEEARASAQLDHINIVRAYDFNEAGNKLYIVMEFVDGIDLHQIVARDGIMSYDAALDAITQACEGLVHAHERGVIHRDIKPSNLMLRSDGVVKVSDMGLARIGWSEADDNQESKRLMGTADFVAPEQALNSKTVDARADIYSLGCTWHFLLTGKPPFRGDSVAQRLAKHQTAPIPDVRQTRSDCPEAVAMLLKRMMAKKPAERPSSAADLLNQLQRLRAGRGDIGARHEQLAAMVTQSDSAIDDKLFQATMEDSHSMPTSEVDVVEVIKDFDFGSLPPLDVAGGSISDFATTPGQPLSGQPLSSGRLSNQSMPGAARGQSGIPPVVKKSGPVAATRTNAASSSDGGQKSGDTQLVMLGIGLAIAVVALVLVVGIAAYTISRPLPNASPKVKAIEDGKGGRVFVVE